MQGKEAIPESVDHVIVKIDPQEDRSWVQQTPTVYTDAGHAHDKTGPQYRTKENWSEGIKRLKPRVLQRIIDTYKYDLASFIKLHNPIYFYNCALSLHVYTPSTV